MRRLFVVLGKLLGVYFLFMTIVNVPNVMMMLALRSNPPAPLHSAPVITQYGPAKALFALLISFLFAMFLIFKTEGMADYFKLKDEEVVLKDIDAGGLLEVGLILVGVGIFLGAVPGLVKAVYDRFATISPNLAWISTSKLIEQVLRIIFALYIILDRRRWVGTLTKAEGESRL